MTRVALACLVLVASVTSAFAGPASGTVKTSTGYARMTPSQAVQVAEAGGAIDPSEALKRLRDLRSRMQAQHQSLTDNADLFKA